MPVSVVDHIDRPPTDIRSQRFGPRQNRLFEASAVEREFDPGSGWHRPHSVYFERFFVDDGGLISYGPDLAEQYPRAAAYVDRILKGDKPADLPVQAPTKYELVI
jgi:ABC transporter substrate binding protein